MVKSLPLKLLRVVFHQDSGISGKQSLWKLLRHYEPPSGDPVFDLVRHCQGQSGVNFCFYIEASISDHGF